MYYCPKTNRIILQNVSSLTLLVYEIAGPTVFVYLLYRAAIIMRTIVLATGRSSRSSSSKQTCLSSVTTGGYIRFARPRCSRRASMVVIPRKRDIIVFPFHTHNNSCLACIKPHKSNTQTFTLWRKVNTYFRCNKWLQHHVSVTSTHHSSEAASQPCEVDPKTTHLLFYLRVKEVPRTSLLQTGGVPNEQMIGKTPLESC